MRDPASELVLVHPGEGDKLKVLGWELEVLVRAEQTAGRMGLIQGYFPVGAEGPPAHRDGHDELFTVLEGEMRFQLEDRVVQAPAGTTLFVPRGTLHTFKNEAAAPARLMGAFLPGGYERYFEEIAKLTDSATPSFEELAALANRFGTTYVGPPIWRQQTN